MNKPPAFQFYPADWLNDIKLQSCPMAAQGVLINLMCLMHQSERCGFLLINGSKPDQRTIIKLLRTHHRTFKHSLSLLLSSGVLREDENGVVYCPRMVKDGALRDKRRAAGKLGGNPFLLKQKVNPELKQKPTPSSSSSSKEEYQHSLQPSVMHKSEKSARTHSCAHFENAHLPVFEDPSNGSGAKPDKPATSKPPYSPSFERFWSACLVKKGKRAAWASWNRIAKRGDSKAGDIIKAMESQVNGDAFRGHDGQLYVPLPATWLNQGRWEDEIKPPEKIIY